MCGLRIATEVVGEGEGGDRRPEVEMTEKVQAEVDVTKRTTI